MYIDKEHMIKVNLMKCNYLDYFKSDKVYHKTLKMRMDEDLKLSLENPEFNKRIPETTPNQTGVTFYSSNLKHGTNEIKENVSPLPFNISNYKSEYSPKFNDASGNHEHDYREEI